MNTKTGVINVEDENVAGKNGDLLLYSSDGILPNAFGCTDDWSSFLKFKADLDRTSLQ